MSDYQNQGNQDNIREGAENLDLGKVHPQQVIHDDSALNILSWLAVLILPWCGLGIFSFLVPVLLLAFVPENHKGPLFLQHTKGALNLSLTLLIVDFMALVIGLIWIWLFFIFIDIEIIAVLMILSAILWILLFFGINIYYYIIAIIALCRCASKESYEPIVIKFV